MIKFTHKGHPSRFKRTGYGQPKPTFKNRGYSAILGTAVKSWDEYHTAVKMNGLIETGERSGKDRVRTGRITVCTS